MDFVFPVGSSGEGSDALLVDEETMRLVMAWPSPPRMLFSWSPPPPSPPAPAGFGGLWDFDDHSVSSLQRALIPAQAGHADAAEAQLVTVPSTAEGDELCLPSRLVSLEIRGYDDSTDGSRVLMEKLTQAVRYFKGLVQAWTPCKAEGRYLLPSSGQTFVLDHRSPAILHCIISIGRREEGEFGLPRPGFRLKTFRCTPSDYDEGYPQRTTTTCFDFRVTVAFHAFDPHMKSCVGAGELIMPSKKVNSKSVGDLMCKALEAGNLTSSYTPSRPIAQILNQNRQSALVDILGVLTFICRTHKLPLAQTWVPYYYHGNIMYPGGSPLKYTGLRISTCDVAFHVADAHLWGFRDACVKQHLQEGKGVVGDALVSNRPCFSKDVSQFSTLEYPLAHDARMFGLSACIAVCLQSSYTRDDVYILELFLPSDCREDGEQKALLESIYTLMKQNLRSMKLSTHGDFGSLQFSDIPVIGKAELKETDAQNPESRHCKSALVLVRGKSVRGSTENPAASIGIVQHHPCTTPVNSPRSKSKSKSKVWNYFTKMDGKRAICNQCKKDYAADPKIHGTSRLLRHLKHDHGIDLKASSSESGK